MTTSRPLARPRPQYSTLCSVLVHSMGQGFLLTVLAGIFLIIALCITAWQHNKTVALQQMTQLIHLTHAELAAVDAGLAQHIPTVMDDNKKKMREAMTAKHTGFYPLSDAIWAHGMRRYSADCLYGIEMGCDVIELLWDRLALLWFSLPLWIGCVSVLLVDGLGQRELRKCQGARESAFYFHRLTALAGQLLRVGFLVYVSVPIFCRSDHFFLIWVMSVSLCAMHAVTYYKKQW
jgi:hypothetical protein